MKYSIVIPTYNHCDDLLKPCVESILEYSNVEDIELIISANGCKDNTFQYIQELRIKFDILKLSNNFKYVWNDEPIGYPKATNEGIKLATTKKIVLLNNDCVILEHEKGGWLQLLDTPFHENKDCGISCVVKAHSEFAEKDFAIFFCVMIDANVFNKIGLLNEQYATGSGEDIEFSILAEENGFKTYQCLETNYATGFYTGKFPIYHKGEATVHDPNLVKNWNLTYIKNSLITGVKFNKNWKLKMINDEKKIAVITPIYNDVKNIFNCINTVKRQTYTNIVHYIYDDCSTDGLEEISSVLKNPEMNVRYFRGTKNQGQSHARNFLIEEALRDNCDYVAFLDSDDTWNENHLQTSVSYLIENDIVYSKPFLKDELGNSLVEVNIPVPNVFVGKQLLHNNFIWISSSVAKSKCFVDNKFDGNLNSIEDWDMWINLWKKDYKFIDKGIQTCSYLCRTNSQASIGTSKKDLLRRKHQLLDSLKLHLACGHDYDDSYINVDLYAPEDARCDVRFDVQKLPYPDNSVDEIKAFHIIEHFHFFEIIEVLKEWYRVLKPGGRLWLETPDFLETCRSFVEGNSVMNIQDWRVLLYGHFFAHPWVPGQTHKFLFTEDQLRTNLSWANFKTVNRLSPASKYVLPHTIELFLNVEAFK